MHNHKWVIICYVEPLVQTTVCRLQQLFVLLCLLQLHVFACTVIIRAIYSTILQMHSGHFCRSLQLLLENGLLICQQHCSLKHLSSENGLWSLIHCCVIIAFIVVVIFYYY